MSQRDINKSLGTGILGKILRVDIEFQASRSTIDANDVRDHWRSRMECDRVEICNLFSIVRKFPTMMKRN